MCHYTDKSGKHRFIPDGFQGSIYDCPHHQHDDHWEHKLEMLSHLPFEAKNLKATIPYLWERMQQDFHEVGTVDLDKNYIDPDPPFTMWYQHKLTKKEVPDYLLERLLKQGFEPNATHTQLQEVDPNIMRQKGYALTGRFNPITGEVEKQYAKLGTQIAYTYPEPENAPVFEGRVVSDESATPSTPQSDVRYDMNADKVFSPDPNVLESDARLKKAGLAPVGTIDDTLTDSKVQDLQAYGEKHKNDPAFLVAAKTLNLYTNQLLDARKKGQINDLDIAGAVMQQAVNFSGGDANRAALLIESVGIEKYNPNAPVKPFPTLTKDIGKFGKEALGYFLTGNKLLKNYGASDKAMSNVPVSSNGYHPDYDDKSPNQFGHCMSMFSLTLRSNLDVWFAKLGGKVHEGSGTSAGQSVTDLKASLVAIKLADEIRSGKLPMSQWANEWRSRFSRPFDAQSDASDRDFVNDFLNEQQKAFDEARLKKR
jgi:hypothetical protein